MSADEQSTVATTEPTCRVCGCTEARACEGGCWWVEDPQHLGFLCSSCQPVVQIVKATMDAAPGRRMVTVNVNLVVDVEQLDLAKIDHLFRGLAKLQEAGADVR